MIPLMLGEEVRDVVGYESAYAVTNFGRVWSKVSERYLQPQSSDKAGHLIVTLSISGDKKTFGIHVLVAQAFIGPIPEGLEVCHNNNNPKDNYVSNLRYDTHVNNMIESAIDNHAKRVKGEQVNTAKLTEESVKQLRQLRKQGNSINALARMFGITRTATTNIIERKSWKHVT